MEHFAFAANATLPLFMVILLGWILKKWGMLSDRFCKDANQYVFKIALPVSLFKSIAEMDLYTDFDPLFVLFCFVVTSIMFLGVWALAWRFMKDRGCVGAFTQAAVRSSAGILGVALAVNIYGNSGLVPLMILAAVPFFNVYSVLILSFSPQVDEEGRLLPSAEAGGWAQVRRACLNILKNPIIIGIVLGFPFSLLRITLPVFITKFLGSVGGTASPVALLVVGASFSGAQAVKKWKPAALAAFVKLMVLPALFLPIGALLGFRDSAMVAILIMTGSPATVAGCIMARSMKGDAVLSDCALVISTLMSSLSITLWLFLMHMTGVLV